MLQVPIRDLSVMPKAQHPNGHVPTHTFNFDLPRMMAAVDSGVISFPPGLSRQERREWVRKALKEKGQA